ncbi:MAG: radical SAM protein [Endomicrobiales bacterium]|nr:radical SAM protein [Endomicrobiales bacterium]
MNQFSSFKILHHFDRIVEWKRDGISRPITYELDMTNVCNSNCPFCFGFYERGRDKSSMSFEEARDIISQIRDFGGRGLTFTGGGEPLCNKHTLDAVKYARSAGLDIGFITNGLLLNEEASNVLLENCTWIRISIDAGSAAGYEQSHGMNGSSFGGVIENLKKMMKTREKTGSGATVGTGYLTYRSDRQEMRDFVRVSKEAGVDYAQFRPLLKTFEQEEINRKPDRRTIEIIEEVESMADEKFKVLSSIHKYENMKNGTVNRKYRECYGHNFATVIAANKKVYLCCHVRGIEKYCLGDLSREKLADIWRSERRKNVSKNIEIGKCPLLCRCDGINDVLWNICNSESHVNFL